MPAAIGLAIGEFLFSVGAPLALVNFFAIGAGGLLAVGIGLAVAGSLLTPKARGAGSVKPSDGQLSINQAIQPRWKHYGKVRIAGPVWFKEADDVNGILHLGQTMNHGPIAAIDQWHIDDNEVTIDGSGNVIEAPYNTLTTCQILYRLGGTPETAYSQIESLFGFSDMRGDGVATMLGRFDNYVDASTQYENFPNGEPKLRATIRASLCWDPRDPAQNRLDPTTWQWSENEVICRLTYLLDADGGLGVPWSRIAPNLAAIKTAADICDEPVISPAAQGSEARYRIALSYLLTDKPRDVLGRFQDASDGRTWVKRDGSIGIAVGRFEAPSVTIGREHIVAYNLTRGQDSLTAIGGVRAQYMSPYHDYREQDAEPWPDGDTVQELDEGRVANQDLTQVPSHGQARRLMKRIYAREHAAWRGTIRTTLYGLKAMDKRYVRVQIPEIGAGIDTTFETGKFNLDLARMECELEIVAVGPAIDAWNPAAEEGIPPAVFSTPSFIYLGSYKDSGNVINGYVTNPVTCSFDVPQGGLLVIAVIGTGANSIYPTNINAIEIDGAVMPLWARGTNGGYAPNAIAGTVVAAGLHTVKVTAGSAYPDGAFMTSVMVAAVLVRDYLAATPGDSAATNTATSGASIAASLEVLGNGICICVGTIGIYNSVGLSWSNAVEQEEWNAGYEQYSVGVFTTNTRIANHVETLSALQSTAPRGIAAVAIR